MTLIILLWNMINVWMTNTLPTHWMSGHKPIYWFTIFPVSFLIVVYTNNSIPNILTIVEGDNLSPSMDFLISSTLLHGIDSWGLYGFISTLIFLRSSESKFQAIVMYPHWFHVSRILQYITHMYILIDHTVFLCIVTLYKPVQHHTSFHEI